MNTGIFLAASILIILFLLNCKKITITKKNIKIIIGFASIIFFSIALYIFAMFINGPILKVETRTSDNWIILGSTYYYNVYTNGFKIKSSKFEIKESESYTFTRCESSWAEGKQCLKDKNDNYIKDNILNGYAKEIVDLISKNEKIDSTDLGTLHFSKGRYFVTAFDNSSQGSFHNIIFEYLPKKNKLVQITIFRGIMSIRNIEAVE